MEKNIVLGLSKDLSQVLAKKGKRVHLTRKGDQRLPLKERIRFVRRTTPDMVLSIHLSRRGEAVVYTAPAGEGGEAAGESREMKAPAGRGIEATVAGNIVQRLKRDLNMTVRQEKLPLPMLNRAQVPALLIELPSPDLFKYDEAAKARLIQAIASSF
jgi:N-acetylmuramoyl-L-alanine amidase